MKNFKKLFIILTIFSFLPSCTWVGTVKNIQTFDKQDKVNIRDSFYLIYPQDGFEKNIFTQKLDLNRNSAKEVVNVFRSKLSEKFGELSISDQNITLEEGFKAAKLKDSKYLIDININQWKDAFYVMCASINTSQANIPQEPTTLDTVDITVFVYDVKTKTLINKQRIENRGCPIVLMSLIPIGKNSPSSRLESMIPGWLENLGI